MPDLASNSPEARAALDQVLVLLNEALKVMGATNLSSVAAPEIVQAIQNIQAFKADL